MDWMSDPVVTYEYKSWVTSFIDIAEFFDSPYFPIEEYLFSIGITDNYRVTIFPNSLISFDCVVLCFGDMYLSIIWEDYDFSSWVSGEHNCRDK